jgi:UDP-GlcNAc:undecaprenyl-phosphate GlcNAc-1-phosphate transferase
MPVKEDLNGISVEIIGLSMYICAGFIVLFMTIDDLVGIKPSIRLVFQALIILLMIMMSDEYISNLGNLFGLGDIELGRFSIPFTIFCVVGLMNAFNMSDGLNGICASFAMVPLIFLMLFGHIKFGLLIPIGALMGFLAYNLGYFGKKRGVFLGDSGSNYIGFVVAMLCVNYSQTELTINPVTALWFVALPLLDCIGVMTSRLLKGVMPFRPGRDHLHHKLLDLGLKPKYILYLFLATSISLCALGCLFQILYPNQEYISFYCFICFTVLYYIITKIQLGKNVKSI